MQELIRQRFNEMYKNIFNDTMKNLIDGNQDFIKNQKNQHLTKAKEALINFKGYIDSYLMSSFMSKSDASPESQQVSHPNETSENAQPAIQKYQNVPVDQQLLQQKRTACIKKQSQQNQSNSKKDIECQKPKFNIFKVEQNQNQNKSIQNENKNSLFLFNTSNSKSLNSSIFVQSIQKPQNTCSFFNLNQTSKNSAFNDLFGLKNQQNSQKSQFSSTKNTLFPSVLNHHHQQNSIFGSQIKKSSLSTNSTIDSSSNILFGSFNENISTGAANQIKVQFPQISLFGQSNNSPFKKKILPPVSQVSSNDGLSLLNLCLQVSPIKQPLQILKELEKQDQQTYSQKQIKPQDDSQSILLSYYSQSEADSQQVDIQRLHLHHVGKYVHMKLADGNQNYYRSIISQYYPSNYFHVGPRYSMLNFLCELGCKVQTKKVQVQAVDEKYVKLGKQIMSYFTIDKIWNIRDIKSQYYSSNYFHVGPRRMMLETMREIINISCQN